MRTDRLFADHARDRKDLKSLHANLMGAVYGDPLSVRDFVVRTRRYIKSHRAHMARESVVLFPMAGELLDAHDDHSLLMGFGAVDRDLPPGLNLFERVAELARSHGVELRDELPPMEIPAE